MVKIKEIKNYSGRKRINIVKDDGFKTGDSVVILSKEEYDCLISENKKLKKELGEHSNEGFDKILQVAIQTIINNYENQLNKVEENLKVKENEVNQLKGVYTGFISDFSSLSWLDVLFRKKQDKIIKEFQKSIWVKRDQVTEIQRVDKKEE